MSPHTEAVHEFYYWLEICLAPFAVILLYRVARWAWRNGWLDESWGDPTLTPAGVTLDELMGAHDDELESLGLWVSRCPDCGVRTIAVDEDDLRGADKAHQREDHGKVPWRR